MGAEGTTSESQLPTGSIRVGVPVLRVARGAILTGATHHVLASGGNHLSARPLDAPRGTRSMDWLALHLGCAPPAEARRRASRPR